MPQLLVLAAIGAGAYFGTRWVRKQIVQFASDQVKANKKQKPRQATGKETISELKKDPITGVYRIEDD